MALNILDSRFLWALLVPAGWLMGLEGSLVPATKGQTEATLLWREVRGLWHRGS